MCSNILVSVLLLACVAHRFACAAPQEMQEPTGAAGAGVEAGAAAGAQLGAQFGAGLGIGTGFGAGIGAKLGFGTNMMGMGKAGAGMGGMLKSQEEDRFEAGARYGQGYEGKKFDGQMGDS